MEGRITTNMDAGEILGMLRDADGYYLCNNERDVSQSDFKNRLMPMTTVRVAPHREATGFFSIEVSGGASLHVDLMRKQVNPFERLRIARRAMPRTLLQAVCRGASMFGYRHYSENVIRFTVREFAKYIDVWRVYDFLNHVPNMIPVFEEVQQAGRILMPSICFSTGKEHTDEYYVDKVKEILNVTGPDVIISIKNHSGLGTPKRLGQLVKAIRTSCPDVILHYHGCNTDGNDIGRMIASVVAGVKICDVADHGLGAVYGQAPALTLIHNLEDYGKKAIGVDVKALVQASDVLRVERRIYEPFENLFRGHDPTVASYKLTGGAAGSTFEQADKGGFLDRMREILEEMGKVQVELGNWWSVTPGSQILWTTAVNNVLYGKYERPSLDLKNLIMGRYGPLPFYDPQEWICQKVLEYQRSDGKKWHQIIAEEGGVIKPRDADLEREREKLENEVGRPVTNEDLALYLLYSFDTVSFLKFEARYGKTWLLPPEVWFRKGGFEAGETISFEDEQGKPHHIEVISTRREGGTVITSLLVDHEFNTLTVTLEGADACPPPA
ncbi:MAG: pyruvate carboxylase [Deltaproteobacteria bacterium]|nr:pyruvate carboxylase [Deltaproteobacteria bacterium]MDH3963977.1 pyruvate carboxylase [Deltaproteobacteria bacterium]